MPAGGGGSSLTSDCHCKGFEAVSKEKYSLDDVPASGSTMVSETFFLRRKGFTLAEVLITLAIIGVVAALTIPTLVANYQNKSWNTAATVFERKLEEALKTMNTQQTLAGYKNTEDFVNELSKHFKITKICKNDALTDCFEDKVYWGTENEEIEISNIKNASKFGQKDWNTETIGLQFANGTTGIVAYNPDCRQDPYSNQITGTSCLALLYDTSGLKNPNTQNKDLRSINVASLGNSSCAFELDDVCFTAPFKPDAMSLADCEAQKGDLGIKECYYDGDYWAGAVKACGGVDKMPTMAQVAKIADYVYNTSGIGAKENVSNLTLDYDKVTELGFSATQGSAFYVWSGEEYSKTYAYRRHFIPTYTGYYDDSRRSSLIQAVCLGD